MRASKRSRQAPSRLIEEDGFGCPGNSKAGNSNPLAHDEAGNSNPLAHDGPGCENAPKAATNSKPGTSNSLDGLMFAIDGPSGSRCENASNQKSNSSGNNFFLVI